MKTYLRFVVFALLAQSFWFVHGYFHICRVLRVPDTQMPPQESREQLTHAAPAPGCTLRKKAVVTNQLQAMNNAVSVACA